MKNTKNNILTGTLIAGANLMGGMCLQCHTQAGNKDYVFSK